MPDIQMPDVQFYGVGSPEKGFRGTPTQRSRLQYPLIGLPDPTLVQTIYDIREMDRSDGRVKKIHARVARDTTKGGLILEQASSNKIISRRWAAFAKRCHISRPEKLLSDARGLCMDGNLPMQWVLSPDKSRVVSALRMAAETIRPVFDQNGRITSNRHAFEQFNSFTGQVEAEFALYELTLSRLDPESYDDQSCMGRPFLDASRTVWRKLNMTETDLVERRHDRAPLRTVHVLEGATKAELDDYKQSIEVDQKDLASNFYLNKKGSVTALQGDATLSEIADVVYLLDSFFSGGPLPKGLMGYTDGMARDIVEDLKRDYYEEIDTLQDILAYTYQVGFELDLLLSGINPESESFTVKFAERRTETANQAADRALKWKALGMPDRKIVSILGEDPDKIETMLKDKKQGLNLYPDGHDVPSASPTVKVTPGNRRKGESATDVTVRN